MLFRSEIKADIVAAPAPTIHIYKYSDMKADDLRRIGESAMEETSGVVIIVSESDSTILLFSDGNFNCGKHVKNHANDFSARGGGKNKSARAVFTSRNDIDAFVKSVRTSYLKKGSV